MELIQIGNLETKNVGISIDVTYGIIIGGDVTLQLYTWKPIFSWYCWIFWFSSPLRISHFPDLQCYKSRKTPIFGQRKRQFEGMTALVPPRSLGSRRVLQLPDKKEGCSALEHPFFYILFKNDAFWELRFPRSVSLCSSRTSPFSWIIPRYPVISRVHLLLTYWLSVYSG